MNARRRAAGGVTRVLFVQGGGKDVHDTWDGKLVANLERELGPDYAVRYPRMPDEADPHAGPWKKAIARHLRELGDGAVLVAHSVGAAILLASLGAAPKARKSGAVFLINPPFMGDGGWPGDGLPPTKSLAAALSDGEGLHLYFGTADQTVPPSHGNLFAKTFPRAKVRRLRGRDHQLDGDLSEVARDIRRLERSPELGRR